MSAPYHSVVFRDFFFFFFGCFKKRNGLKTVVTRYLLRRLRVHEDLVIHHEPQRLWKVDRHQSAVEIFSCCSSSMNEMFFPGLLHGTFQCRRKRIVEEAPCGGHTGRNLATTVDVPVLGSVAFCVATSEADCSSTSSSPVQRACRPRIKNSNPTAVALLRISFSGVGDRATGRLIHRIC